MADTSSRRVLLLVAGVVVLVVGLVGAGALWYAGDQRLDDAVADLARAPSGCATTLDFERTGDFTVYVETTGEAEELSGDCEQRGSYDRDDVPDVALVLVDPDGVEVDILASSGTDYDTGDFAGTSIGAITIDEPGEHVMTVPASGAPFAVAVGGDPNDGVAALRWGAVGLAVVGLVAGTLLLIIGSRRTPDTVGDAEASASAGWPTSPPGFPAPPPTTGATAPAVGESMAPPHPPATAPHDLAPVGPPTRPPEPSTSPATWGPPTPERPGDDLGQ
jgi:hypothetical protein